MANVRAINEGVNETHDTVCQWVVQMAERGELPENTARIRATALEQMVTVLDGTEPRDPVWLHENIDDIGRRWAVKNTAKPATAITYIGRARTLLGDYLRWKADFKGFKFKIREPETKAKKAAPRDVEAPAAAPAALPPSPTGAGDVQMRRFPLSDGREDFRFILSPGFTMNDARKIAFHLATLAEDFDPLSPAAASFGLVVSRPEP